MSLWISRDLKSFGWSVCWKVTGFNNFYSSKCYNVVPAGCLLCIKKPELLVKQRKSALWFFFLRLLLSFWLVFVTAQIVFFFFFSLPAVHTATKTKWRRGERRVQWSLVIMHTIILLSCGSRYKYVCLFSAVVRPAYLPIFLAKAYLVNVIYFFPYVCACTVNSLSCQIPLGEFEQIVFSIWWKYSGYRYREMASVKMTSKVLEELTDLAFDNFWCGSWV